MIEVSQHKIGDRVFYRMLPDEPGTVVDGPDPVHGEYTVRWDDSEDEDAGYTYSDLKPVATYAEHVRKGGWMGSTSE